MRTLIDPTRRAQLTLAIILALPLLIATVASALSHSWYPYECCSHSDCWAMGEDADAREPKPIETAAGWRLHDGVVIPFNAARPSPDGRFHVCRYGGSTSAGVIRPSARPPCLFVPQPGS